ncbi:MAG: hypothetical protein ACRDPT_05570 [Streptomycetales bacterium]
MPGCAGYTAIAGWVADVPAEVLAEVYMRAGAAPAGPPPETTIWRVLTDADSEAFDVAIGTWLMNNLLACAAAPEPGGKHDDGDGDGPMQVRLDGKTVRGAKSADGSQLHLLAAVVGPPGPAPVASVVVAQAEVPDAKPKETTVATSVLAQVDLNDKVVTADALHTVKATATYIHDCGGHFVFPVKENRQALFDATWTLCPGPIPRSLTSRPTADPAASPQPPAPSRSCLHRRICRSRTSTRCSSSSGTSPAWTGSRSRPSPSSRRQPHPRPGDRRRTGPLRARSVDHRGTALAPRHDLAGGQLHRPHPIRPRIMASLRNLAISALRVAGRTEHHRGHPMGRPEHDQALHHPRPHLTDLGTAVLPGHRRLAMAASGNTEDPLASA